MRNEGGYVRGVDKLNLTPVSNLDKERIAFLLKVSKLLIRLSSFHLGSLTAKKISKKEKVRQH
jgi:hypothetical protein